MHNNQICTYCCHYSIWLSLVLCFFIALIIPTTSVNGVIKLANNPITAKKSIIFSTLSIPPFNKYP